MTVDSSELGNYSALPGEAVTIVCLNDMPDGIVTCGSDFTFDDTHTCTGKCMCLMREYCLCSLLTLNRSPVNFSLFLNILFVCFDAFHLGSRMSIYGDDVACNWRDS